MINLNGNTRFYVIVLVVLVILLSAIYIQVNVGDVPEWLVTLVSGGGAFIFGVQLRNRNGDDDNV